MPSKYEQIKTFLMAEALKPESRIKMPTIAELRQRFRASQSPVSRAIRDLEEEGILYCRRGVGIVSRTGCEPISVPPKKEIQTEGSIIFLSVDYFASTIWDMTHTLNSYSQQLGYTVHNYRIQRDTNMVQILKEAKEIKDLRGGILMSSADWIDDEVFQELGNLGKPSIILDSYFAYDNVPDNITVLRPDAFSNGKRYIDYLVEKGHEKIGFVRSVPDGSIPQEMLEGATESADKHGIELHIFSDAIKSWENAREATRKVTFENLNAIKESGVTALIYIGAGCAVTANRIMWEKGIKVPQEISILAHGDNDSLKDCIPAISSAKTDFIKMCCDGLDIIAGKKKYKAEILYPSTIIDRESIKTIKQRI